LLHHVIMLASFRIIKQALWHENFMKNHYDRLYEEELWHEDFLKKHLWHEDFIRIESWEMLDIQTLFSRIWFQPNVSQCHNPMRLWHSSQNDRSHGIVTHQVGTKFWKKVFGCLPFLSLSIYTHYISIQKLPN